MTGPLSAAAKPNFLLCDYFNRQGRRIDRIFICMEEGTDATDKLRADVKGQTIEPLLDAMKAEAKISGAATDTNDAALALNAYLHEIESNRVPISEAVHIASIGVNFRKAISIAEILPALEAGYGGNAVSWACGISRPLRLGSPYLN